MLAMSSVYLIGSIWTLSDEFFTNRKQFKQQTIEYRELLTSTERTLAHLNAQETQIRGDIDPPVVELCLRAADPLHPSSRLWERRSTDKDFLQVRFGVGPAPSSTEVHFEPPAKQTDLSKEVEVIIARFRNLEAVPLTVDFKGVGSLGVAGPSGPTNTLVISMLCQIIGNHSPNEVRTLAIFPTMHLDAWDWLRWAPHSEAIRGGDTAERSLACTPERARGLLRLLQDELSARERRLAAQGGLGGGNAPIPGPHLVVLLDGDDLLADSVTTEFLLSRGPALNVFTIYISRSVSALPSSCGAVIATGNTLDELVSYRVVNSGQRVYGTMDVTSPRAAEGLARTLGPLQLVATDRTNGIPDQVRLLDLFDMDDPATVDLWPLWEKLDLDNHLRIPLGYSAGEDILYLSLQSGSVEGGPHGIVGGMTGSGKSELLRSIVAAFAISHHPHLLNFVLIDYKGGSAFQGLEELPHVVGFVTNLDEHLAERALVALQSELKDRQRRLLAAGVDSVSAYQELYVQNPARDMAPLPNLVLVIDEFAQLKEEVPDFIKGLIEIARVGRSLGVHLLLATQKPNGVVTDEIRANTSYKVCLRVRETSDSTEVIGTPDAALLPSTVPGRAFIQVASESIMAFQAARITTPYTQPSLQVGVAVEDFEPASKAPKAAKPGTLSAMVMRSGGETELQVLVRRIAEVATQHDIKPLRSPWPPPLPNGVALREVAPASIFPDGSGTTYPWSANPPHGWACAPIGLLDDPARQSQEPFVLRLGEVGHVLLFGMARTGKSTFLRTAGVSLALTHSPRDLHLYCLDFGRGALAPLAKLPHCGDVLQPGDIEKVRRFVSELRAEMVARAHEIQQAGVFTLTEYRSTARRARHFPYIVVLLDNFSTFRETFFGDNAVLEMDLSDRLMGDLTALIRDGQSTGIHFLITADSWGPVSRYPAIINAIGMRIALRQSDSSDFSYVGMRVRDDLALPAGRGFVGGANTLECQIAMPATGRLTPEGDDPMARRADYVAWLRTKLLGQAAGPRPKFDQQEVPVEWMSGEEQTEALEELCEQLHASWQRGGEGATAPPIRELPEIVSLKDLLPIAPKAAGPATPVGLEDAGLRPFMLELRSDRPVYLVAGPAQSGKSTLLLSAILGISNRHTPDEVRIAAVAFRRSPIWKLDGHSHFVRPVARKSSDLSELIEWLGGELDARQALGVGAEEMPPILVVMDDLEEVLLDESAPHSQLVDVAKRGRALGLTLLVAGLNQEIARSYDPLSDYLRRDQTGFLLTPNLRDDGDIMSMRLPMMTHRAFPPGRGFFVRRRSWTIVQVAVPGQGSSS
jgi:S-DNA-T family DNA segregation ATPase FtsK/SpoIIIE